MSQIVIATHNLGKVREFQSLLEKHHVTVKSLYDINYEEEIEETGVTFEENALIKARAIAERFNVTALADDSGLEIDALGKRPGVYSARFAGEQRSDADNMDKVLIEMAGVEQDHRRARFVCVLAVVDPKGKEIIVRGECEGVILHEKRGNSGFGYDPIFYLPELKKTMAELSKEEKNAISHRANAFKLLEERIDELT
ncbi:MAG: XTP/dITP diphosphatase [Turicibacter sp.]|nr:XTP/dITP diphosphatase [Turicibacter sp.]